MKYIICEENYKNKKVGNKAENLFLMKANNINVPSLFCVNSEDLYQKDMVYEVEEYLEKKYKGIQRFAIRSSSLVEDQENISFAGQFQTYLNIEREAILDYARKCFEDVNVENIKEYSKNSEFQNTNIYIVIQEMINADKSGILFTANPQGILNETVITVGKGTGNNVVEDKVDTTTYYYNQTDKLYYEEHQKDAAQLNHNEIEILMNVQNKLEKLLGKYLDIEFSIKEDHIYILQARRITTLNLKNEIVLDNSNIVESYPGITLPLTESFVGQVYYQVFKSCLLRLTKEPKTVMLADEILRNMTAAANGRIYYQISNWYNILLFLPFHEKIIPIWQEMLGVENKKVTSTLKGKIRLRTYFKVTLSFFMLLKTCPAEMEELNEYFTQILKDFNNSFNEKLTNKELIDLYKELENRIATKWDITLANDMYTFIYTSLVKQELKKKGNTNYKEITNEVISNISNLESMKPIEEMIQIAKYMKRENKEEELRAIKTHEDYMNYISNIENHMFSDYIEEFGDRNIEELKLESKTFRTHPLLFIKRLLEYIEDENLEQYLQKKDLDNSFKYSKKVKKYLQKAETGIRNREKSRLNRSRAYGMMRKIILQVAKNFVKEGKIKVENDIFYLYYDEIEKTIDDNKLNLEKLVEERKEIYALYEELPVYSRMVFDGKIINKTPIYINKTMIQNNKSRLKGIPCSNGIITGEVIVMKKGQTDLDVKDKILVAQMTDPGWVFYITRAKGIISEMGSLLSHTAIISRELGKPSVVGVKDATHILKTGDIVKLDAYNGEIEILDKGDL